MKYVPLLWITGFAPHMLTDNLDCPGWHLFSCQQPTVRTYKTLDACQEDGHIWTDSGDDFDSFKCVPYQK